MQKEYLEKKVIEIAERGKIIIKRETLKDWGLLVFDNNRIHFLKNRAKELKFEDTPVHGTLLAAYAESFVLDILDEINNSENLEGKKLEYSGHRIYFKRPLYPGNEALWNVSEVDVEDNGISLNVSLVDNRKKPLISCPEINLAFSLEKPEKNYFFDTSHLIAKKKTLIEKDEKDFFYACLGKEPREEVAMMHVASAIPSALLNLMLEKTGKAEGVYTALELEFYNKPSPGVFETLITLQSEPSFKRDMYFYDFEAICSQEEDAIFKTISKPILKAEIKCISKEKLLD